MEEKESCKYCLNCGYYCPYYTKGYYKFSKTKFGSCREHRRTVGNHDVCDSWVNIGCRYKTFSKNATKKALYELLSQLSEIRQIIEEYKNDDETD